MDLDPLAGAKIKGISSALLLAEPHPVEAGRIIVMVATDDGVVTIWEGEDSRCGFRRSGSLWALIARVRWRQLSTVGAGPESSELPGR